MKAPNSTGSKAIVKHSLLKGLTAPEPKCCFTPLTLDKGYAQEQVPEAYSKGEQVHSKHMY